MAHFILWKPSWNITNIILTHRSVHGIVGRHSKNIAAKKMKLDAGKTKAFNRATVKIIMAAKSHGTDPSQNVLLQRALREAAAIHLPKDNIDRALKKAAEASDENYSHGVYEIYGHGGIGIVVTTLTDNANRAVKEVRRVATKAAVKMASSGSVLFTYEHKGIIKIPSLGNLPEEKVLDSLLEYEVDSFEEDLLDHHTDEDSDSKTKDKRYEVVTSVEAVGHVLDALHGLGIQNAIASLEYRPIGDKIAVSEEEYESNMHIIDDLEELHDVDKVFHNMAVM